jgi:hypothetical protein
VNRKTTMGIGIAAAVLALGAGGASLAFAMTSDGGEVSGSAADQARTAAVQAVPGSKAGTVQAETNEGNAAYGVLVTKPDGAAVEVHLDKNYKVMGTQAAGKDVDTDGDEG